MAVSLGHHHTLLLTSVGTVLAFGDNTDGQCAQGDMKTKNISVGKVQVEVEICSVKNVNVPTQINYSGPPVIKVGFMAVINKSYNLLLRFLLERSSP